jgi:ATP-dependent Clp protease ATP-binding subunit ClpB
MFHWLRVIIMTSNLGSQWIQQFGTGDYAKMRAKVMETLKESLKPEFLNRIDEIIIYHALPLERIKQIIDIQLEGLEARLADRTSYHAYSHRQGPRLPGQGWFTTQLTAPVL